MMASAESQIPARILAPAARALLRLLGAVALVCALWLLTQGGAVPALFGGFLGALALRGFSIALTGSRGQAWLFPLDFLALSGLGLACSPEVAIWTAPAQLADLLRLSLPGAIVAWLLYSGAALIGLALNGRRAGWRAWLALLLLPFLFNLLMTLGSPLLDRVAEDFKQLPAPAARLLLRGGLIFLVNEAMVAAACIAMGRRVAASAALHLLLLGAAFGAAVTPLFAEAGSTALVAGFFAPLRIALASLAAALAQAGLWAEVYLVTGLLGDIVHGAPPVQPKLAGYWRSGGAKGAVYGGVFMALLLTVAALIDQPLALDLFLRTSYFGAALAGAVLFPLARTILESTDSTPPFLRRLRNAYRLSANYIGGAICGVGVLLAFSSALPQAPGGSRALFGFGVGALAYVGALLFSDFSDIGRGLRGRLRPWRPYGLAILLGGLVGGAIGWYFDQAQLDVVAAHYRDHVAVNYPAAGRPENPYVITPFFSKWGVTHMGLVTGGVKLLYLESLSGVIQWIFAAPLFSINLFFLTALLKRDLGPIKLLFSAEGVRRLADNAIVVLRWGLWMAPIIYAFLKVSPYPEWYNQDGLIRTTVAAYMNAALPPSQFRDWSLAVFTAMLTFDWLRVLIWFDHMGLRVATLVNLSFVGGDIADEGAGKFLGAQGSARAIPEAIRRFGTWAPLLIPFYIPRGAEWDKAWDGAEAARALGVTPLVSLLLGYGLFACGFCAVLALFTLTRSRARARTDASEPASLTNGMLTQQVWRDGQNFLRIESAARRGAAVDMTRAVDDPIVPRGGFVYFSETPEGEDSRLWSLAPAPTGQGFGPLEAISPVAAQVRGERFGLRCDARIEMDLNQPLVVTRITLRNLTTQPRRLLLATYRDWVMNEGGVERRDSPYNSLHVGTFFARPLGAIFARNRLLKNQAGDFAAQRLSREIAFHAAQQSENVRLVGYEDVRARFFGLGQRRDPDAFKQNLTLRDPADEGLLYGFDPCAVLMLEVDVPAEGTVELTLADGWAEDEKTAAHMLARLFGVEWSDEAQQKTFARKRVLLPAITPQGQRFAFSDDGRSLQTAPGAPRPFAHVMANPLGLGVVATHDGDLYAFHRNARANSLTPFRMGESRNAPPGQAVYVVNRGTEEVFGATLLPLRRPDTHYDCTFTQGAVTYTAESPMLRLEQSVFVAPDDAVQVILLKITSHSKHEEVYRIAPVLEIILAETPPEALGALETQPDPLGRALFFQNPRNAFVQDWVFAATSFEPSCAEHVRARILGASDGVAPFLALHGHADAAAADDGRRAAGFSGIVLIPPGGEATISVVLGAAPTLEAARSLAARAGSLDYALEKQAAATAFWQDLCAPLRIETNRPDFDRLVNDWLPYQLLAARLWGRTGPSQRSGAYGYRDQLQDVLPLMALAPELARKQILLHGSKQFVEGDVLKWWHEAPSGGVGIGERTHASDPHLWLPYVTTRYVVATGDAAILHESLPFIEGAAIPPGVEGYCYSTLPSQESASLLEHCRRAIDYALAHFGKNGLPLMGAGDWDDGMNLVGFKGRGESVWVGFFLHDILVRFAALLDSQGDAKLAQLYATRANELTYALDACWRGDRYVRAFADDGQEFLPMGAMSSAWPSLSGAAQSERGRKALENGLAALDKGDRVLLVTPPYDENSKPFPGRSGDYPPGVRENGGQYTHGSSWFIDALAQLGEKAASEGDSDQAARDFARAFQVWESISPLTKCTPDKIDIYGLPPHQQPADVYEGPGYEGRGGWSWYSGAAARMISTAHAVLGLKFVNGELQLRADAFDDKAGLQLKSVTFKGKAFVAAEAEKELA